MHPVNKTAVPCLCADISIVRTSEGKTMMSCPERRLLVDVASMILMKPKEEHYHASGLHRPCPFLSVSIGILGVPVQIVHKRTIKVPKGMDPGIRECNRVPTVLLHTAGTVAEIRA